MRSGPAQAVMLLAALAGGWTAWRLPIAMEDARIYAATAFRHGHENQRAQPPRHALVPPAHPVQQASARPMPPRPPKARDADRRTVIAALHLLTDAPSPPTTVLPHPAPAAHALAPAPAPTPAPASAAGTEMAAARAHALAAAAYDALAVGARKDADRGFAEALALDPAHVNARTWADARRALGVKWHGWSYAQIRARGTRSAAANPVLGASQAAAEISYRPDPLAARTFDLFVRGDLPLDRPRNPKQLGGGLRWRPLADQGLALQVERLISIDGGGRSAWAMRAFYGRSHGPSPGTAGPVYDLYGEAGIIGARRHDPYAGAAVRGGHALPIDTHSHVFLGAGIWAAAQDSGNSVARLDVGPVIGLHSRVGSVPVAVRAEWRARLAGDADPGSGLAITLATSF